MAENEAHELQTHAGLVSVVAELERSVEAMTLALEQVKTAMKHLSEAAPLMVVATSGADVASPAPALTLVAPAPEASEPALTDEEAAREEVRRTVEAARKELSWTAPIDAGFFGTPPHQHHTPAVHHVAPHEVLHESVAEPESLVEAFEAAVEPQIEAEAPRDDVAAVVAEWHREEAEKPFVPEAEPVFEDAVASSVDTHEAEPESVTPIAEIEQVSEEDAAAIRREEVRLAVEAARAEMKATGTGDFLGDADEEAKREEVRRAVADARNAMSWGQLKVDSGGDWGQFKPESGGFTIRADQHAPPAPTPAARPEPTPVANTTEPAEPEVEMTDEEARREAVRRTVEAARTEMMKEMEPEPPKIVPILSHTGRGTDFSGPPVIVFEDAEGRVELSQVFATLSRVDRSSQAALLNYTPHSVTIGLTMLSAPPDIDSLTGAAEAVFGRKCTVKSEGPRTAIEISSRPVGSRT